MTALQNAGEKSELTPTSVQLSRCDLSRQTALCSSFLWHRSRMAGVSVSNSNRTGSRATAEWSDSADNL